MAESTSAKKQVTPSASKKKISKKKTSKKKVVAKTETPPEATESVAVSAQPIMPVVNSSGGSKALSWIALLFSAVALCAGGYAWYLTAVDSKISAGQQTNRFELLEQKFGGFDSSQSDINTQINQLKNQVALAEDNFSTQIRNLKGEISQQEAAVKEQLNTSAQDLNAKTSGFRQEFDTLSDSIVNLRGELGRSIDSWTLEEVEQLMFVANQRLQFAGDHGLAAKALQLADDRLQQLANPALNSVRALLSSEISALNNISSIDVTDVLNRLSVLANNIEALPLTGDVQFSGSSSNKEVEEATNLSEATENVQSEDSKNAISRYTQPLVDAGAGFFSSLGDLIQVEKNGKALRPLISAEGRQITFDKAKLILESAQIAFIREQAELYQSRLSDARLWVQQNFDSTSKLTSNWVGELDALTAISPQTETPDITGSLSAIREFIQASKSKD